MRPRPDAEVDRLLFRHPYFSYKHTFIREEQGRAVAFTCGCVGDDIPRGKERGYFTCLVAEPQWDTPETTAQLLNALEDSFRAAGRTASAVTFFNPMHLPWGAARFAGHEHNNMPGHCHGTCHCMTAWLAHGYTEATQETAMYRTLADFAVPDTVRAQEQQAAAEGQSDRPVRSRPLPWLGCHAAGVGQPGLDRTNYRSGPHGGVVASSSCG